MIGLGLSNAERLAMIEDYRQKHAIKRVFQVSPKRLALPIPGEVDTLEWADVIRYVHFYDWINRIDSECLVVLNEILIHQDRRTCLNYNCIRNFLNQTRHQLVFQTIPMIDSREEFMILFDLDTQSRWKTRTGFDLDLIAECEIIKRPLRIEFNPVPVAVDGKTAERYQKEKRRLIDGIGLRDPHTIPRNLYLLSGKAKLGAIEPQRSYVGRNNRFNIAQLRTYSAPAFAPGTAIFEFCHDFSDFSQFMAVSDQRCFDVLTSDLKVDGWYLDRYRAWADEIHEIYSILPSR